MWPALEHHRSAVTSTTVFQFLFAPFALPYRIHRYCAFERSNQHINGRSNGCELSGRGQGLSTTFSRASLDRYSEWLCGANTFRLVEMHFRLSNMMGINPPVSTPYI